MTVLTHVPDISKWQAQVDISRIGPAVILRAHSGRGVDPTLHTRQAQARQHCTVVGYYGYCVPDRDPISQAREMAAAVGKLKPGEFTAVDLEQGSGQQSARAEAYAAQLDRLCGGRAWLYSGLAFYQAHLARVKDRHLWIAAYRDYKQEPSLAHTLWQHTDGTNGNTHTTPGVGRCDCSVFHGSAADLRELISPTPAAKPATKPAVRPVRPPAGTPTWWTHPVKLGSREQEVASVARRLNVPLRVSFDLDLDTRVRYVQRCHHLAPTGVVDAPTAKAIG